MPDEKIERVLAYANAMLKAFQSAADSVPLPDGMNMAEGMAGQSEAMIAMIGRAIGFGMHGAEARLQAEQMVLQRMRLFYAEGQEAYYREMSRPTAH